MKLKRVHLKWHKEVGRLQQRLEQLPLQQQPPEQLQQQEEQDDEVMQ